MDQNQNQQTTGAGPSPLDQLEAQVNLVLEHTGRLFAGSARSQKGNGVVNNPTRLRQVFVGANDNFNDALDVLEEELAIARAVMRRDLAVCRTAIEAQESDARSKEQTANGKIDEDFKSGQASSETAQDTDVTMTGDSPTTLKESPQHEALRNAPAVPEVEQETHEQTREAAIDLTGNQSDAQRTPKDPLQLEIPSGEHSSSDNPTDAATGTYSNFDFESLFNDPSAQPSPNVQPPEAPQQAQPSPAPAQAPRPEPHPEKPSEVIDLESKTEDLTQANDQVTNNNNSIAEESGDNNNSNDNDNDTFDFGDLTNFGDNTDIADNDNISSLLPGLESYANAPDQPQQSENPPDTFNIFDAAGAPDFGAAAGSNATAGNEPAKPADQQVEIQGPTQGDGEMRDSTFDDLMNFDNFDMGNFGGEDDDGKTAFDASFFDIS